MVFREHKDHNIHEPLFTDIKKRVTFLGHISWATFEEVEVTWENLDFWRIEITLGKFLALVFSPVKGMGQITLRTFPALLISPVIGMDEK
jgi:hypothetical protein